MEQLSTWAVRIGVYALYAYVLGTGLWLLLYAPSMYRRMRTMQSRLDALEHRVTELTSQGAATRT